MSLNVGVGNVLPSFYGLVYNKNQSDKLAYILDFLFKDNALLFQQPSKIYGNFTSFADDSMCGLPLLGFTFKSPTSLEFCRYSYCEYPYLNKAVVANNFQKESGTFTIEALRPITKNNSVMSNYILNKLAISQYIENYADKGGLFALNTMYGYFDNLALESLRGIKSNDTSISGVAFEFTFKRLNFASVSWSENVIANELKGLLIQ